MSFFYINIFTFNFFIIKIKLNISITFVYKSGDSLFVKIYLEGYLETKESNDIYKVSGFDKEIFCDAIGLSLSAVENY